ncbi:hypothetical protein K458DRAFT_397042 [Lentithecium fluviatile CBS 122367]|uniref:Uncharacterized protein n=1 Tax=Lentithecium fluviatile CBS 122367 TaxID=1168545 RepID=A0A6G1IEB4_9PLEO|nr:hypothetical protein K458DRAFT_397042 [Lentithecium fluviatile CBS 122367]
MVVRGRLQQNNRVRAEQSVAGLSPSAQLPTDPGPSTGERTDSQVDPAKGTVPVPSKSRPAISATLSPGPVTISVNLNEDEQDFFFYYCLDHNRIREGDMNGLRKLRPLVEYFRKLDEPSFDSKKTLLSSEDWMSALIFFQQTGFFSVDMSIHGWVVEMIHEILGGDTDTPILHDELLLALRKDKQL